MLDLFVFLFFSVSAGRAVLVPRLQVPSSLRLGTDQLQLSCRPSESSYINRIQIERKPASGTKYSFLVYIDPGSDPVVRDDDFRSRAVVKGEAGFAKAAFLEAKVSQNQVTCNEWGYYKCKITYYDGNSTKTATSNSLLVNFIVPPSSSPPSLMLSPSNIPHNDVNTYRYLRGTTVVMGCRAEVGFPASLPMRFCIKKNSVYELVTDLQTNYITPASTNSAKSCVMVRTILALYPVTTAGKVYCDVYNATTNTGCATHMTSTYETFSVQDYPVCNASSIVSKSTTPTRVTTGGTATPIPMIGGPAGMMVSATQDYTLLILGCVLMLIAVVLFVTSVLLYLQAKKIRKEAEMVMIRNTYDSVQFNSKTAASANYSSLENEENHYHQPLEKQDSDGYVVPKNSFR